MNRLIISIFMGSFSLLVQAADIPEVVNSNNLNLKQACIDNAAGDCINRVCQTSPELNCQDTCQTQAQVKCSVANQ